MNLDFLEKYSWKEFYTEPAHIFAVQMAIENRTKMMEDTIGVSFKALLVHCIDNIFTMWWNFDDAKKVAHHILSRLLNEPTWSDEIIKNIHSRAVSLQKFSRTLGNIDYTKMTNEKLYELYFEYVDKLVQMRLYSSIPLNVDHQTSVLTDHVLARLKEYVGEDNEKINIIFSQITSPTKYTYIQLKQIDFFNLASLFGSDKFEGELNKFVQQYIWSNYTFSGDPLDKQQVFNEVKQLLSKKENLKNQINEIKGELEKNKKIQFEIYNEYNFSDSDKQIFDFAREIIYLKFFRKGIMAESYYYSEFLLNEIAKRLSTDLKIIQGMQYEEVRGALCEQKFNLEKIERRIKDGWLLCFDGKFFDLPDEYLQIVLPNTHDTSAINITSLSGQTACVGCARGKVKIINRKDEMGKMEDGDIIISHMTSPDLVPAMRKASAIVTDIGGMTCHAAVISRELKIPCIVGTNNATAVFKDGMEVEVDAGKGFVKLI